MKIVRFSARSLSLAILLLALQGGAAAYGPQAPTELPVQWDKVDDRLASKIAELGAGAEMEFILRLTPQPHLEDVQFRREEVIQRLVTASNSQNLIVPALEEAGFVVKKRFWITNALLVEGHTQQIGDITRFVSVHRIHENFEVSLVDGEPAASTAGLLAAPTWGLAKVRAPLVWSALGAQGEGVRVCVSDTGVDASHPDLAGKIWSDVSGDSEFPGGWIEFDFAGNPVVSSIPHDTHGHGTHTSGTVLGAEASGFAIGMAPKASLMHALALPGGSGSFAQVIAGIEWCVSPHDDQGNPAGAPADVHSMSWAVSGFSDELIDPLRNSYLAGTLPVAAAGNCGLGCSGTPGNSFDVLGIGASDANDFIADFSSGEVVQKSYWSSPSADWPTKWITPAVSAPGVNVYSSLPGGIYDHWSGTSMATPHVAGCAALMLSANPTTTPAAIRQGLVTTAVWFDTYNPSPPDPRYGWGRLDCYAAVESVAFNSGIGGTLVDQGDGTPVDQAFVNVSTADGERFVRSDLAGAFRISLKPGIYNLSVERFGYGPQSLTNLAVLPNEWVDLHLELTPFPGGNITGAAFHDVTGFGIPGVTISLDVPVDLSSTTDAAGTFSLRKVPEGTYSLRANSPYFLDQTVAGVVVIRDASTVVNFLLTPKDWVAVMGDQKDSLSTLLRENGYYVESPDWGEVIGDPCRYDSVVVNHPSPPGSTIFNEFISATDAAGTGVIFLDTYEHTFSGGGIYYLWTYRSDPATRGYNFDALAGSLYYEVTQSHPILDPFVPGNRVVLEDSTTWHDHAWFSNYSGQTGTVLAQAGTLTGGDLGAGIAVDARANNRHVLLSLHGASGFVTPKDWTADGTNVFLNAVDWAKESACGDSLSVDFDIDVSPPVGLWSETFQVSIKVKNVGADPGSYTAQLYVDDAPETNQTVSLLSGETKIVAFQVHRDPVGTYVVSVGSHTTSFRVRSPSVTVQASDLNATPLAGARISVGLGSTLLDMGGTNGNGTLTFDAPNGSHGQYWVVLQAHDVGTEGQHYFLSENLSVEDDVVVSFLSTPNSTATLAVSMEEVVTGQAGAVALVRTEMPSAFSGVYTYRPGTIIVNPANYSAWAQITVQTIQNMWTYRSASLNWDLTTTPLADLQFGGRLTVALDWARSLGTATVDWNIKDAYGNALAEVMQRRVGLPTGETIAHVPFLSLWNPQGTLLAGGYVAWDQKPANFTLPEIEPLAYVQVDLETGPYPFDNTFELTTEVLDGGGTPLPTVAVTRNLTVEVRGTVLLAGRPLPVNLTVRGLPVAVDANGTFSQIVDLNEGLNAINVTARDLAGNTESVFYLIQAKPRVYLSVEPLPQIVNVSQVTVEGVVEAGAQLTVNGNPVQPDGQGAFSVTLPLREGANVITVVAVDAVGNREEVSQTVVLDTVPPDVWVTAPAPDFVTRDDAIQVEGSTEATATLRINGVVVSLANGSFAHTVRLHDGANDILLEVTDVAGNLRTMSLTVRREPRVSLSVEPLPQIVNVSQVTVEGVVEAGAQLTVNGNPVQPDGQGAFSVTLPLREGANVITVVAVDAVGNREEVSQTVVLDTVPPDVWVTAPAPDFVTRDDAIQVEGSTEATATLRINGVVVSLANGSFAHTVRLHDGANDILLEVTDVAGNLRTMSLTVRRELVSSGLPLTYYWAISLGVLSAVGGGAYVLGRRRRSRLVPTYGVPGALHRVEAPAGAAPPTERGNLVRLALAVEDLDKALQSEKRVGPPQPMKARPPRAWRRERRR